MNVQLFELSHEHCAHMFVLNEMSMKTRTNVELQIQLDNGLSTKSVELFEVRTKTSFHCVHFSLHISKSASFKNGRYT